MAKAHSAKDSLTKGQRAYEERRAAQHGMSLDRWLAHKATLKASEADDAGDHRTRVRAAGGGAGAPVAARKAHAQGSAANGRAAKGATGPAPARRGLWARFLSLFGMLRRLGMLRRR